MVKVTDESRTGSFGLSCMKDRFKQTVVLLLLQSWCSCYSVTVSWWSVLLWLHYAVNIVWFYWQINRIFQPL